MLTLKKLVKRRVPVLPYERIARRILGTQHETSLVFAGDALTRKLNARYRRKKHPTNILAFPLSASEGEIFLNLARAREEARRSGISETARVGYLFIHALLHLKGFSHGSRMESEERKVLDLFGIRHEPKTKK